MLRVLTRRLRALLRKGELDHELDEEVRFHLEKEMELNRARGLTESAARTEALRRFGGVERVKEEARDARGVQHLESAWQDVRYGLRMMRKTPSFAIIAVLTLALGIGATTAIFSVVYGVLLKPLPFPEPDRLVGVWHQGYNHGPGTYFTYRDHQRVFEDIGAWESNQVSVTGSGEPERVEELSVTDATLPLLRVRPLLGRLFSKTDERPGSPVPVVLSHGFWQRRFGGASDIVGKHLTVDGVPREIIGVLPASFRFLRADPAVLRPMQVERGDQASFDFQVLARLKPGVTLSQAQADMARMIPMLPVSYANIRLQPNIRPLAHDVIGDVGRVLWLLLATVGIVLLMACANVANLFFVRAEGRQQELAVRAALGASRGRIARALLSESLLLALAGGVVGLIFAQAGLVLLRRLAGETLPRVDEIGLDWVVLTFTFATSVLTGLLFGLIPVVRFGQPKMSLRREDGRTASDGPVRQRTRNTLVVAQVAMALVLLVISGLMIRTFVAMRDVRPGFVRPAEVQTFRVDVPAALVGDEGQMARTHELIAQRLGQVPGVVSVGLSSSITMDGEDNLNAVFVEDLHAPYDQRQPGRRFKSVAAGYFETMGNPLVAGRAITWDDIHQARPVVAISEKLAREFWSEPSQALGKRIGDPARWHEIVGVTGNERDDGLNQPPTDIVYWPLLNEPYQERTVAYAVRSPRVGARGFLRELQQAVWSVNRNLPLANLRTLEEIRADSMAETSFAMVMLAIAAAVALTIGLVGIYGVIAYVATQRTREIGIRLALGAQTSDVRRLLLRHGLWLAVTGIALGVAASLALTRTMSTLLFGVGPTDPITYAAVSAGLAFVALLATWLPARRASRIDPMVALHAEV